MNNLEKYPDESGSMPHNILEEIGLEELQDLLRIIAQTPGVKISFRKYDGTEADSNEITNFKPEDFQPLTPEEQEQNLIILSKALERFKSEKSDTDTEV